ncbi:hypothetical protein PN36_34670 [Candidatus Thiomargarita nelsonii]|uniref:PKD domain-containing protein n=1 Tax=Candidatus Thiomargarita nelsonii TaxID=1003181 RepID=A0A4E0QKB2_9GAMM|nr:hypothetical protein PN36_34670 [Candidatus Thiomargarita nelsonii]
MSFRYFAFAVVMSLGLAPPVLAGLNDGLVAYYPFNGNANDESGNGNHGTVHGPIEYVEGIVNQAVKLNGTDTYIRIANPSQKFDTQYTITGWVYTEGRGGVLAGKYTWGAPGGGRGFNLGSTTEGGSGFAFSGSTFFPSALFNEGWSPSKYPKYTMPIGVFEYITAVYDEGNIKIYINGIIKAEKTISHNGTLDNPYDMLIGTYWQDNGTTIVSDVYNRTFDGLIDDLRIYNRVLSESEIQALNTNADFTTDKISGEPPLTVQFSDASAIDEPITSWAWDFDNDGTIDATDQHPTYTYNQKGLYSASLTVSDGENEHSITKNDFILVYDALLRLNSPVPNTLTEVDEYHYYKIDLEPGNSIQLTLDDDSGNIELYVAHNAFPSRTHYDYQSTDQEILIPIAEAGDWYVLVYGSGNYEITAHIDIGILSTVQFSSATYSVTENGGQATITVTRSGGRQDAISANYATSDGTAIAGSDYSQTAGTLNWGNGDFDDKTFTIAITDDSLSEDNETFTISLSDPVSGENLDNATVTIQDYSCIEGKPCLVFEKLPNRAEAIKVGERLTLNLNIEVQATESSQPVDLYVALALPPEYVIPFIFLTERAIVTEILSFRESIVPQQGTFPILDFNVGECLGGTYTYYAAFVRENAPVDINDLASNLAMGQFRLEDKCF